MSSTLFLPLLLLLLFQGDQPTNKKCVRAILIRYVQSNPPTPPNNPIKTRPGLRINNPLRPLNRHIIVYTDDTDESALVGVTGC